MVTSVSSVGGSFCLPRQQCPTSCAIDMNLIVHSFQNHKLSRWGSVRNPLLHSDMNTKAQPLSLLRRKCGASFPFLTCYDFNLQSTFLLLKYTRQLTKKPRYCEAELGKAQHKIPAKTKQFKTGAAYITLESYGSLLKKNFTAHLKADICPFLSHLCLRGNGNGIAQTLLLLRGRCWGGETWVLLMD